MVWMVNGKRYMVYGVCAISLCIMQCVSGKVQRITEWKVRLFGSFTAGFPSVSLGFFTANKKNSVKSCDNHKAQNKHVWGARWARYLCVLPFDCGRRWPTVRPAVCGLSEINIRLLGRCAARRASGWKATEHRRIVRETMQAERDIRVRVRVRVPIPAPKLKLVLRLDSLNKYLRCIWQLPEIVDFVCIYIHLYNYIAIRLCCVCVCVCVWLCGWRGLRDLYRLHEIIC